jgi:hypothetical protein
MFRLCHGYIALLTRERGDIAVDEHINLLFVMVLQRILSDDPVQVSFRTTCVCTNCAASVWCSSAEHVSQAPPA